jgi:hypothetical protein
VNILLGRSVHGEHPWALLRHCPGDARDAGNAYCDLITSTIPSPSSGHDEATQAHVFNLDLCVLAYHVYNQSLLWPLDPWYETWSRIGSSRRDNMLTAVHEVVAHQSGSRGPGSTRAGWPTDHHLDPVISDYQQIRPWVPCISRDDVGHRLFIADDTTMQRIREVVVSEYTDYPGLPDTAAGTASDPANGTAAFTTRLENPTAHSEAADRLYAFEGCTGAIEGRPGAWGLLGIVLERDLGNGDYDVHIVYRGSQSGDAYRAAFEGFVGERGNPDWVTDMEFVKMVEDERFAPTGSVVRGLRDSTLSSLGTLLHCLAEINATRSRPPKTVHVAGHSLGGGLAIQLAAAFAVGNMASSLDAELPNWPWQQTELTTYGAPKAGDDDFAEHFDRTVAAATRILVDGDPITKLPLNAHVGTELRLRSDFSGTVNHEPAVIRDCLIAALRWNCNDGDDGADNFGPSPWQAFPTMAEALMAAERAGHSPSNVFGPHFEAASALMVQLAGQVIEQRSSYKSPYTKLRRELRRRHRKLDTAFETPIATIDELSSAMRSFRGIQPGSDVEDLLRCYLIIREATRHDWAASALLADRAIADAMGTGRWVTSRSLSDPTVAWTRPAPDARDIRTVKWLVWMRKQHYKTVNQSSVKSYRRRVVPTSSMPDLVPACSRHAEVRWAPRALTVANELPPEAKLPMRYVLRYYALGKLGWNAYHRSPIRPDVLWDPAFSWNSAFPSTIDGWEHPTDDATYTRLRLQGPNPFLLRRVDDPARDADFEVDFTELLAGVLPPIVAEFRVDGGELQPTAITVGGHHHHPGDETWDQAKRLVNAADVRHTIFGRHLLEVHLLVGQAFALATFDLPTWHQLRPFMQFFTYGSMFVNDAAYKALVTPKSYFVASGFVNVDDARRLFENGIAAFDFDTWNAPRDIANRGIDGIANHPYVDDAMLVWPAFVDVVDRHLDDVGLTDEIIAADADLQAWYITLTKLLPNTNAVGAPLDRARLNDLCTGLLWNNVIHEICGDFSPILGSEDPADKAIINLDRLRAAVGDGRLDTQVDSPTMADVFLMDQASYTTQFNVGGNNILAINAAKWVDDPRLRDAIVDLQDTLRVIEVKLQARNLDRPVRFARMLPSNWEASISF